MRPATIPASLKVASFPSYISEGSGKFSKKPFGAVLPPDEINRYCGRYFRRYGPGVPLDNQGQCGTVKMVGTKQVAKIFPDPSQYTAELKAMQGVGNVCGNPLRILDFGMKDGKPFIVYPRIPDHYVQLPEYIRTHKPFQKNQAIGLLKQLKSRLECFTRAGFVHADLHPGNMLISDQEVTEKSGAKVRRLNLSIVDWGIWCKTKNLDRSDKVMGWRAEWGPHPVTCRQRARAQVEETVKLIASHSEPPINLTQAMILFNWLQ